MKATHNFLIYSIILLISCEGINYSDKAIEESPGDEVAQKSVVFPKEEKSEQKKEKWYNDLNEALLEPDSVEYLTLREKNFQIFPPEIIQFSNLKRLDFSMNSFEKFPDDIGNLKELKYLVSAYGRLKKLPNSIGKLKKLTTLNLLYNHLETIPKSIGNLESLEELNLYGNPIREIPDEIFRLKRLKALIIRTDGKESLISKQEQDRIRSNLPNCRISFE